MTDTIIKGTGDSRSIKSAPTIPATWEEARAQLISSGWLIDLGGPNAEGCSQIGTAINKANLLKDTTAALFGLTGTAVPDEVFSNIKTLINSQNVEIGKRALFANGSYAGMGSATKTIQCGFTPKFVYIAEYEGNSAYTEGFIYPSTKGKVYYLSTKTIDPTLLWGNTYLTFTSPETSYFVLNRKGANYNYIAIG